ncbi:MAG: hypothetical protein NVS9B12_13170 [Vulcanimicrobiaceae bacterium]
MPEVQSAIQSVKPRGRQPVKLKNGKMLADARREATQAWVAARAGVKAARSALRELGVKERSATKAQVKAESAVTKATGKVAKDTLAILKNTAKEAAITTKNIGKQIKTAHADLDKALKALAKADAVKVNIENERLAALN